MRVFRGFKRGAAFLAFLGMMLPGQGYPAAQPTLEDLQKQMQEMKAMYESRIDKLEAQVSELRGVSRAAEEGYGVGRKESEESRLFLGTIRDEFKGRIVGRTILGGYADLAFFDIEDRESFFDQTRLVPFIYADVTDKIKLASEIEFEHGGTDNNQGDGEIKVEFAVIDYQLMDPLNFRAGIILTPLGHFNLIHDSPINDLTDRPLVDRFVIPTTLSEAGAGFYGTFYPTELSKIDYEIYLVNGFQGFEDFDPVGTLAAPGPTADVGITQTNGLRGARGSQRSDINDNKAVTGRVAISPWLGTEVGLSGHFGDYDEKGENLLAIYAVDTTLQYGPFELIGEYAVAHIERDGSVATFNASRRREQDKIPGRLDGAYVQLNYHFMLEWLKANLPSVFGPESIFTLVGRYDWIDLGTNDSPIGERQRWSSGINFRPVEDTVFKFEYQFNDGDRPADDADALVASVATYF